MSFECFFFLLLLLWCGFISEWLFKNATDYIVNNGYKDAGYEYVIIDDCWMEMDRDPVTDELIPDRKRFPNGLKPLADYVSTDIIWLKTKWISFFHFSRFVCQTDNLFMVCFCIDSFKRAEIWSVWRLWHEDMRWISRCHQSHGARRTNIRELGCWLC